MYIVMRLFKTLILVWCLEICTYNVYVLLLCTCALAQLKFILYRKTNPPSLA